MTEEQSTKHKRKVQSKPLSVKKKNQISQIQTGSQKSTRKNSIIWKGFFGVNSICSVCVGPLIVHVCSYILTICYNCVCNCRVTRSRVQRV